MHKRLLQVLALAVCLGLLPAAAYAKDHRHNDHDRGDRRSGRDFRHDHDRTAGGGPPNRPAGWDQGNKTGWGDCNVPPGLAKQRGCDSRGFSTRERGIHASHTTATTSRTTRPGETRGIILQRNGATTSRTTRPGETRGIILQRNTATTSRTTRPGETRGIILQRNATSKQAVQK